MNKFKIICLGSSLGVAIWSIHIDLITYNVIFKTDKSIVAYCLDGLMFNVGKIILPIVAYFIVFAIRKIVNYENWFDRCRQP